MAVLASTPYYYLPCFLPGNVTAKQIKDMLRKAAGESALFINWSCNPLLHVLIHMPHRQVVLIQGILSFKYITGCNKILDQTVNISSLCGCWLMYY